MTASLSAQEHAVGKAGRIFRLLTLAADSGLVCPTNAALAEAVGYSSTSGPANAVSFLATAGMIRVERANRTRVVTIVATGRSTCGTVRKAHHSAKINACSQVTA